MYGNSLMINNQLMSNIYYRNAMKQNILYYSANNNIMNINQMNFGVYPQQFYNNYNYINYQNQLFFNKTNFPEINQNKFDFNNVKPFIPKSKYSKNNSITKNCEKDEYINLKNQETSFKGNEIKNRSNKKASIDTNYCNKSFCTTSLSSEENDNIEKNEEKQKISMESENEDFHQENEEYIKKGRRYSNKSKASDCSNCSKSTSNTTNFIEKEKVENNNCNNDSDLLENEKKEEKYIGNPAFENTVILNVNVRISKDRTAIFKLKRFDDLFLTIKLFCEINSVDEKLIKPLIIKSLSALNTIYQVMNSKLDNLEIKKLKEIKNI